MFDHLEVRLTIHEWGEDGDDVDAEGALAEVRVADTRDGVELKSY